MTKLIWDMGTAYDFFISLYVLYHPEDYGLRRAWAAGVRSRLPAAERAALNDLLDIMFAPLAWIYELPAPKDSATLLAHLSQMPAAERLTRLALGPHVPPSIKSLLLDVIARRAWTEDDHQHLRDFFQQHPNIAPKKKLLPRLLDLWAQPEQIGEQILQGLKAYHAVFFAEEEIRINAMLQEAVSHAQEIAQRLPLSDLLDELAQGVSFSRVPETPELVLIPSFWVTPLVALVPYSENQTLYLFGARPANVSLIPGEVVPDMLYKALKALADPTRLQILRYLTAEPMMPADLARRLRLRPPTVTHHLQALRIAGLIRLTIDANGRLYTPRTEAIASAYQALQTFLESKEE